METFGDDENLIEELVAFVAFEFRLPTLAYRSFYKMPTSFSPGVQQMREAFRFERFLEDKILNLHENVLTKASLVGYKRFERHTKCEAQTGSFRTIDLRLCQYCYKCKEIDPLFGVEPDSLFFHFGPQRKELFEKDLIPFEEQEGLDRHYHEFLYKENAKLIVLDVRTKRKRILEF